MEHRVECRTSVGEQKHPATSDAQGSVTPAYTMASAQNYEYKNYSCQAANASRVKSTLVWKVSSLPCAMNMLPADFFGLIA